MNNFFILDGEIERIQNFSQLCVHAFGVGDMVTEDIRLFNTQPLFFEQHFSNICETLNALAIPYPAKFDATKTARFITRLLNINKVYKGGICKIIVYRNAHVFDGIDLANSHFAIFIEPLDKLEFVFNTEGLRLGVEKSIVFEPPYLLSQYSLHFHMKMRVLRVLQQEKIDALCFFNNKNSIFHTSGGDIFYVKEDKIYTPSISINRFRRPISELVILFAKKSGFEIIQVDSITENELATSDEIFVIDTIQGLRWVNKANDAIFGYKTSKKMYVILMKLIEKVLN